MSSSRDSLRIALAGTVALMLAAPGTGARAAEAFPGIGRTATPAEVRAWDIDVRPDFKGLPAGRGSVALGQQVWEAQCASCHGIFGESNDVFTPLIGGTTKDDQLTGRVARLRDAGFPQRTTMMKLSSVATLWDYVNRAMPWNAPKTLKTDEVYAVTAYVLNMAGVVADDFVLSDANIREVQARLPNRNGMTTAHAMWPGPSPRAGAGATARPDVQGSACMRNCAAEPKVASLLPDFARNAHGNLAEQQRPVGPQRGADTTRPMPPSRAARAAAPAATAAAATPAATAATLDALALARKNGCMVCHGVDNKVVGPGLRDVARRHAERGDREAYLLARIVGGSSGVWGPVPMPAQTLPEAEAKIIARWLAAGMPN
jgi:cytochrome c